MTTANYIQEWRAWVLVKEKKGVTKYATPPSRSSSELSLSDDPYIEGWHVDLKFAELMEFDKAKVVWDHLLLSDTEGVKLLPVTVNVTVRDPWND